MSHPFGDRLTQYLHRKHGLSQSKLAAGILQAPAIITDMCKGRRLSGPQACERVLAIIDWLWQAGVQLQLDDANGLLAAAGMAPLQADMKAESVLLGKVTMPQAQTQSASIPALNGQPRTGAAQPNPRKQRARLPNQLTGFIGREVEQSQITERLAEAQCRLLTLAGAGGVGKTRLAIQVATVQQPNFSDGVWFVPLAPLRSAQDLAATCLEVLGIDQHHHLTADEQLVHYLSHKQLLLVLDNYEHLLPETTLLQSILHSAEAVKILITSRERLRLQTESLFAVGGLALSDNITSYPKGSDRSALQDSSAIRLFVERARNLNASFALTADNGAAISHICRTVNGMPLAIELAVGWTRLLTCDEIATRISSDLDFLSSAWNDLPPRHQSLSAVFAHSWALLSPAEQHVLQQLAIFRGGFTANAAAAVASASLTLLGELVDKSWLQVVGKGRFDMHELIRQYVTKKRQAALPALANGNETESNLFARHSRYYGGLLHEQEPHLYSARQLEVMNTLLPEVDNIRQGWHWAVEQVEVETIGKYLKSWQWLGETRSWDKAMMRLFGKAIECLKKYLVKIQGNADDVTLARIKLVIARALHCQARHGLLLDSAPELEGISQESLTYWPAQADSSEYYNEESQIKIILAFAWYMQGNYTEAEAVYLLVQQECAERHDQRGLKLVFRALGLNALKLGRFVDAENYFQQSLAADDQLGERAGKVSAMCYIAELAAIRGDYERSDQIAWEVYQLAETFGITFYEICSYNNLGYVAILRGEIEQAKQYYTIGLKLSLEISAEFLHLLMKRWLGYIAYHQSDYEASYRYFEGSLTVARSIHRPTDSAIALTELAKVACAQGEWQTAQKYLQQSFDILQKSTTMPDILDAFITLCRLWIERKELEDAARLSSFALHHPSLLPLTRRAAMKLVAELQEILPAEKFIALQKIGEAMSLEEVLGLVESSWLFGTKQGEPSSIERSRVIRNT